MEIIELPIKDYINGSLEEAKNNGFLWIMILLARKIEAEESYEQLKKNWDSFDDLTSKEILFLLSVAENRNEEVGYCVSRSAFPWKVFFNPYFKVMSKSLPYCGRKQKEFELAKNGLREKAINRNTNYISELCDVLNVSREDIPAMVLINTLTKKKIVIPLGERDLYSAINDILCSIQMELREYKNLRTRIERVSGDIRSINSQIQEKIVPKYVKKYFEAKGRLEEVLENGAIGVDINTLRKAIDENDISYCKSLPKPIRGDLNKLIDLKNTHKDLEKYTSFKSTSEEKLILEEEKKRKELEKIELEIQLSDARERLDSEVEKSIKKTRRGLVKRKKNKPILIVTANDNETNALLDNKKFTYKENVRGEDPHDRNHYNVGTFCDYDVVHFQLSAQGSVQSQASSLSTDQAIIEFNPCAVILLGIAFGIDEKTQHIGDVLISKRIIDYESGKVSENSFRSDSDIPGAGEELISACQNLKREWNYDKLQKAQVFIGDMASGDKVIDNKTFLELLPIGNHKIIGGEMEGRGVYAACKKNDISEWIVIKSICDWGYGKSENKEKNQKIAAKTSVEFLEELLANKMLKF